jgi:hypothetical protein
MNMVELAGYSVPYAQIAQVLSIYDESRPKNRLFEHIRIAATADFYI